MSSHKTNTQLNYNLLKINPKQKRPEKQYISKIPRSNKNTQLFDQLHNKQFFISNQCQFIKYNKQINVHLIIMKKSEASLLQTTLLPALLLQTTILKLKNKLLTKRQFFHNFKQYARQDAIVGIEIAPLSRNQQPNISAILNVKSGPLVSETFGTLIQNFEILSKNCHVCGSTLYKQYRQRVNDLQKYTVYLQSEKKKHELREKQLTQKIKTLRFQTVPVNQFAVQTDTNIDDLVRKQIYRVKEEEEQRETIDDARKQLQNKQNYLKYMQEIINNRQIDLDRRQNQLLELQKNINQEDIRFKTEPLNHLIDSKRMYQYFSVLKDRIYDAVLKYQSGQPNILKLLQNHPLYDLFQDYQNHNMNPKLKFQILKLLQVNILELRYKLELSEDYFYNQVQKIAELKKDLEEKNIKFIELNSYQHFLDRYRQLLDEREEGLAGKNVLFKEEIRVIMEYLDIKSAPGCDNSETSFSFLQHIDKETKGNSSGRGRIFTLRQRATNIIQEYKSLKPALQKQFLSQKINKMKQEHQAQFSHLRRITDLQNQNQQLKMKLACAKDNDKLSVHLISKSTNKQFDDVLEEAQKKKRIINALTKMFKFSFHKNIKNPTLSKGLAWLVWRSRQYDPESYDRIKELMNQNYQQHEQSIWKRRCSIMQKQKLYPYKALNLKRKQFLQQFFDYERKHFFKQKLKTLLLSITKNKVRKQRMVFIVYFHRFVRNSLLNSIVPKIKPSKSREKISSRTLKSMVNTNSKTTISFDSNNTKRSNKLKDQSMSKQLFSDKHSDKQRIQYQKRYRKMLSCSKFTHIFRSLCERTKQQTFRSFVLIKQKYYEQKLLQLQSLVDQVQFDNNMFVTKYNICQSSISSKMSLLEELLALAPK